MALHIYYQNEKKEKNVSKNCCVDSKYQEQAVEQSSAKQCPPTLIPKTQTRRLLRCKRGAAQGDEG